MEVNGPCLVFGWKPKDHDPNFESSCDVDDEGNAQMAFVEPPFKRFSLDCYNTALKIDRSFEPLVDSSIFECSSEGQSRKVLIVDDQVFNIEAVKGILEFVFKFDLTRVHQATDGEEALEMVKKDCVDHDGESSFSLILIDCNMPFMDGFEATSLIRQFFWNEFSVPLEKQPTIVALTGHVEPMYLAKCFSSGMNQVLSKPVEYSDLGKILEQIEL